MYGIRIFFLWILLTTRLVSILLSFGHMFTATKHKLFIKTIRANASVVYYQHRLALGHLVEIPCFPHDEEMHTHALDPVAYEWLLNGRQILPHLSFMKATWDLDGVLCIYSIIPREYTLWCHMRLSDETEDQDLYFAHQIKFFHAPVRQIILKLDIGLAMDGEAWERKCDVEEHICDCRRIAGENATERFSHGPRYHYLRTIINELAISTCEHDPFCHSVSLDDFQCINAEQFWNASHVVDLSFFLDVGMHYTENTNHGGRSDMKQSEMIYYRFESLQPVIQQRILTATMEKYYAKEPKFTMTINHNSYLFCMGYASALDRETEECVLCPSGSFAKARLSNPKPPFTTTEYKPLKSDQPHLNDEHAREALRPSWLNVEEKVACSSCPVNTYTEETGRQLCLPCPIWHMRPKALDGDIWQHTGADWLQLACPPEGRNQLRLVQVAQGMLGTRFAQWVKESSPLSRVAALLVLSLIPMAIALVLLFIAYMLIDVGAVIIKMANELHPLQIQAAETAIATASFKADHQKAAEEVYAKMRGA